MEGAASKQLSEVERLLLDEVSADRLWGHTEALARWERISGTPAEREAVAYLEAQLREFGLETTVHEFESLLGWPEAAQLEVRAPGSASYPVIAHSFTPSTPPDGIEAEVVYAGQGGDDELSRARGKIALVEGIATPLEVLRAGRSGVAGLIFVGEDRLHDMCVSPVWGTPTTRTAPLLPRLPAISIRRQDGERLKELARDGLRVWMKTATFWGWRTTPLLVGELRGRSDPAQFVLFSGHHCSWYRGAMDNGAANATMLEVARILGSHRDALERSVRIAFWPGHTQGRYAGSTWYFDQFWEDLRDNCVLHVNADSTGARGATIYRALSMAQTSSFAAAAIRDAIGVEAVPERQARAGDQSFWPCGVPSVFMDLSNVPPELAARAGSLFSASGQQVGGLPWWWHTPEDTIDKIDRQVLARDTRVYVLTVLRAAAATLLPFRYRPAAEQLVETVERYQRDAGERFDLGPAIDRARGVAERSARIDDALDLLASRELPPERVARLNRAVMEMDRELVMLDFTTGGPFDQDLAIPVPPVPLLEPVRRLARLDPRSDQARFLATELTRNRNQAVHHLRAAGAAADRAVEALLEAAGA